MVGKFYCIIADPKITDFEHLQLLVRLKATNTPIVLKLIFILSNFKVLMTLSCFIELLGTSPNYEIIIWELEPIDDAILEPWWWSNDQRAFRGC